MTPMNESLLKTDQIGRLRYTTEQNRTMLEAYRVSGLSAPRFAAHHGVSYQTLISWIKKEKQSSTSASKNSPPFFSLIPTVIDNGNSAADEGMELSLPGGANPLFPALRSGHRLFQRPSHKKQIPAIILPSLQRIMAGE